MNEPIISPFIIYLMGVLPNLQATLALVIGVALLPLSFIVCEYYEKGKSIWKIVSLYVISILLTAIIPSKETMIQMPVANQITYERVDIAKDVAIKVYNDILNVMQK